MTLQHIALDVYDNNRKKLCNLYDSSLNSPGQAHDIKMVVNINGSKTLSFEMPFVIEKERNFRWNYIKNEYFVRVEVGSKLDWFVIDKPQKKKDKGSIGKSVSCSHISLILKTKNIYMTFDDENGIDTMQVLVARALNGSGWSLGHYDTMLERDETTEKIRSYHTDGKQGAYQMVLDICKLFGAYPIFNGETKTVDLYAQNNKGPLREMTIGKDLSALTVDFDSSSIITRLYVEGEYGDYGYVGIDDVEENEHHLTYLLNFDYYKEIGLFTQEHQAALDQFYEVMPVIAQSLRENEANLQRAESELSGLWGMCTMVYWTVEDGQLGTKYTYGTVTNDMQTLQEDDEVVIVGKTQAHPAGEYRKAKAGLQGALDLLPTDIAVIKYGLKASGTIGGKEVSIETKESLIEGLQNKIEGTSTITYSTKKKTEFAAQQAQYREEINVINEGTAAKDAPVLLRESNFAAWVRTVQEYATERDSLNLLLWLNNRDEELLGEFGEKYPDLETLLTILTERQSAAEVLTSEQMTELTGWQSKEGLASQMLEMDTGNVDLTQLAGATPSDLAEQGWTLTSSVYKDKYYIYPAIYRRTNAVGTVCIYAMTAVRPNGEVVSTEWLSDYVATLAESTVPMEIDADGGNGGQSLLLVYRESSDEAADADEILVGQATQQMVSLCDTYYTADLYSGSYWSWLLKCATDTLNSLNVTDVELWYDDDTVVPAVPGLHELYGTACDLFMQLQEMYNTRSELQAQQLDAEAEFQLAMGDLLRDGYWNDDTYSVGQEEYLYKDAVDMLDQMSKPKVTYKVSRVSLSTILGYSRDDLEINMRVRVYDADLGVNDMVYVSAVTLMLDDPSKDDVTISNEDINLTGGSLSDLLSRLTSLADMLEQKNAMYSRASAITADGGFLTQKLEGTINVLRNQLSSTQSGWYTDANGNMIFEAADGQSAMMLCGAGFMIAYGKLDSGEWNWRTKPTIGSRHSNVEK